MLRDFRDLTGRFGVEGANLDQHIPIGRHIVFSRINKPTPTAGPAIVANIIIRNDLPAMTHFTPHTLYVSDAFHAET